MIHWCDYLRKLAAIRQADDTKRTIVLQVEGLGESQDQYHFLQRNAIFSIPHCDSGFGDQFNDSLYYAIQDSQRGIE